MEYGVFVIWDDDKNIILNMIKKNILIKSLVYMNLIMI